MRQGQSKRIRGRSRGGTGGGGGNGGGGGGGGKGGNQLNRSYESNGPDVKIRGTAGTIADKYVQLSRDALTAGDPVAAENYMQHAEHYYRLLAAAQAQYQPHQTVVRADADDFSDGEFDEGDGEAGAQPQPPQPSYPQQAGQNNGYQQNRNNNNGGGRHNGPYNQAPRDGDQGRYERRDNRPERRDGFRQDGPRQDASRQDTPRQDAPRQDVALSDAPPRQDFNRQDGERQDNERPSRNDRSPERSQRRDREPHGDTDAPVGGLPAFITGGGTPTVEQAPPRAAAPEPKPVSEEVAGGSAPAFAQDDGDPRESGGPSRGRRRRYGRRSSASGEDGAAPDEGGGPQPGPSGD